MRYRIFVILFTCLLATSLFAQERPNVREIAQRIVDTERTANRTVSGRADALADLAVSGAYFISNAITQIEPLVNEIAELAKRPEGNELSVIKFDLVKERVEILNRARDKGQPLQEVAAEIKSIDGQIADEIVRSKQKLEATRELLTEKDRIEGAYISLIKSLAHISRTKLAGEKTTDLIDTAIGEVDAFTEKGDLAKITLTAEEATNMKRTLSKIDNIGEMLFEEYVKDRENRLSENPTDYRLWEELSQVRFAHLQMTDAVHTEYLTILQRLQDEIDKQTDIERQLIYLHAFYSGWVNEIFDGDLVDTRRFYETAVANATTREDRIRALSKIMELRLTQLEKIL